MNKREFLNAMRRKPLCSMYYKRRETILASARKYENYYTKTFHLKALTAADDVQSYSNNMSPPANSILYLIGLRHYTHQCLLVLCQGQLYKTTLCADITSVYELFNRWFEPFGEYQGHGTPKQRPVLEVASSV